MNLDDYPIGTLVSQKIYEDKSRYGVVYKTNELPKMLWVYWQLNETSHAVAAQSYSEAMLIEAVRPEKYLNVIALPKMTGGKDV